MSLRDKAVEQMAKAMHHRSELVSDTPVEPWADADQQWWSGHAEAVLDVLVGFLRDNASGVSDVEAG